MKAMNCGIPFGARLTSDHPAAMAAQVTEGQRFVKHLQKAYVRGVFLPGEPLRPCSISEWLPLLSAGHENVHGTEGKFRGLGFARVSWPNMSYVTATGGHASIVCLAGLFSRNGGSTPT